MNCAVKLFEVVKAYLVYEAPGETAEMLSKSLPSLFYCIPKNVE